MVWLMLCCGYGELYGGYVACARIFWPAFNSPPIRFPTMLDAVYRDLLSPIINRKQDPIVTNPQAVAVDTGQFLNLWAARLSSQLCDPLKNELTLGPGDRTHVLLDAPIVDQMIHVLKGMTPLQASKQFGVGENAPRGPDGVFEVRGVLEVFQMTDKSAVVRE